MLLALVAAAGTLSSSGCRKIAEKANGSPTVASDASNAPMGASPKIPADFPTTVPIYPGAKAVFGSKSPGPGNDAWSVQLETADTTDEVLAYYKANMSDFSPKSTGMGNPSVVVYERPTLVVTLIVTRQAWAMTSIGLNANSK
jgi:hypothetical protein